jgi:putative transposase
MPQLREQPEYYGQKRDLVRLKQLFPEYKDIQERCIAGDGEASQAEF